MIALRWVFAVIQRVVARHRQVIAILHDSLLAAAEEVGRRYRGKQEESEGGESLHDDASLFLINSVGLLKLLTEPWFQQPEYKKLAEKYASKNEGAVGKRRIDGDSWEEDPNQD